MRSVISLLILLINVYTTDVLSQEWNWRNKEIDNLEITELKQTDYSGYIFLNKADFRRKIIKSEADFQWAEFSDISDFRWTKFALIAKFNNVKFFNIGDFRGTSFDSAAFFRSSHFLSIAFFWGTQFHSKTEFFQARFDSTAYFCYSDFGSDANFLDAYFSTIADFHLSKFHSGATFLNSKFENLVKFSGAIFESFSDFRSVEFKDSVDFYKTNFYSKAHFEGARFGSYTNFESAIFYSNAIFKKVKFDSIVNFQNVTFNSTVNFIESRFNYLANFKEAKFKSQIYFDNDILPQYLNFSYVTDIESEIDLTNTVIDPRFHKCYINLTGTNISKLRFRYKRFKLWFPSEDSIGYEFKANVYEELLKKQKDEGFTQSYEILDKEYKEFQYTDSGSNYGWITGHIRNLIDKNWWGYSYDKERIVWNTILIYLLLSLINTFWLKHLTTNVYANKNIQELWESEKEQRPINRFFNRFRYSLFYTAVIFFGLKFDMEKLRYKENLKGKKAWNLIYFFTIYIGGFVCLAYLANYIITI